MILKIRTKRPIQLGFKVTHATPGDDRLTDRLNSSHVLTIDAEWANLPLEFDDVGYDVASFLSSQYSWMESGKRVGLIVWHPDYPFPSNPNIPELSELIVVQADPLHTNPFTLGMCGPKSDIQVLMFYAPHDVRAMVGTELWKDWLLASQETHTPTPSFKEYVTRAKVDKKRKLNGRLEHAIYGTLTLRDVIGTCTAGMGLDKFHESVGIHSPYKKLSDGRDKGHMETWMRDDPNTFLNYAMGDVLFLEDALTARVAQVNTMIFDALGFNPEYVLPWETPDPTTLATRFPMSAGSLVSTTFEKHLEHEPKYNRVLTALLPFTLFSDRKTQQYYEDKFLEHFSQGVSHSPLRGIPRKAYRPGTQTDMLIQVYHPISYASIPSLIYQHSGYASSGLLAAIVYGGRCVNERGTEDKIANVLDIDLNSCYGSALDTLTLPIGFPTVYKTNPSDCKSELTLGEFLARYGSELVDDCYTIYVDGLLPFFQDLIASKPDITALKIKELATAFISGEDAVSLEDDGTDRDNESSHIPGSMVHLTKEISNGVITSDLLKAIHSVADQDELSHWLNLTVSTAVYYARSGRKTDVDDFEAACTKNSPLKYVDAVPQFPNIWYAYPISEFVGALVSTRKVYKGKGKSDAYYNLLQNGMKLFINTAYGCLASPYFAMGNTVIANVITARARLGAWMMSKALGSVQSITDGGAYSHDTVRFLKPTLSNPHKPGFDEMSNYDKLNKHRNIKTGPLTSVPFPELKAGLHSSDYPTVKLLEAAAIAHINSFWSHYNLTLPFEIEHKYENTSDLMAFSGSANYLMLGSKSPYTRLVGSHTVPFTLKCRGVRANQAIPHCKESYLWALSGLGNLTDLYTGPDGRLTQPYSTKNHLLGVKEFQANPQKFLPYGILPGDNQRTLEPFKPNHNYLLPATVTDWETSKKAHNKASRDHDKALKESGAAGRAFGVTKHKDRKRKGVIGSKYPAIAALPTVDTTHSYLVTTLRAKAKESGKTLSLLQANDLVDKLMKDSPDIPLSKLNSLA